MLVEPLARMQDEPTYESWVVCLENHQGFLASVHAEATRLLQGLEMLPTQTIVQVNSRHDTSQLRLWWWCLAAAIQADH